MPAGLATVVEQADIRRQHGYHPLRVREIVRETADTCSFVLDVPDDLTEAFAYQAGQFCTFRVRMGEDEHLRSYSMSSAPETDDRLAVTVKRVPNGLVSNWLHDHVAEGDVVEVTRPAGVFCRRDGGRPVVAFCGGSGITPVMSITKSVLASTDRPVRVLYANRDRAAVIFDQQFAQLADTHPGRLQVRHHLDDQGGLLQPDAIRAFVGEQLDADLYICGPTGFMDLVETTLLDAGVAPERIAMERFDSPAAQPSPGATPTSASESSDTAGSSDDAPREVTVILKGKRTTIGYQAGDTLLETARRGGLKAPFSCEAGDCATCMALLHEGTATMRANNALDADEVDEGWVLTCQAIPHGSQVTVEYESF